MTLFWLCITMLLSSEQRATSLPMARAFGPPTASRSEIDESGAPCVVLHTERRSTTLPQETFPGGATIWHQPYMHIQENVEQLLLSNYLDM
jgi:hypothetical protein